jgi:hypothetical protein
MNELIESGDPRARVVGKRIEAQDADDCLRGMGNLNRLAMTLRGRPMLARHGVHRFNSFEDAEEWMTKMMLR